MRSYVVAPLYGSRDLTESEAKLIEIAARGLKSPEIAAFFGITDNAVRNKLKTIYDKLGLFNRTELALWFVSRQVVESNTLEMK